MKKRKHKPSWATTPVKRTVSLSPKGILRKQRGKKKKRKKRRLTTLPGLC